MDSCPRSFIRALTLTSALASSVANVCRNPWTSAPRARSASMPARRNARSTRYCRVPRVMRSPSAPTNSGVAVGQAANPPPGEERRLAVAGKRAARVSR
jgi:hypothetical protein